MSKLNLTDEDIEKLIEMAETRGQGDPYKAVNKDSGALGRFQLLKSYHEKPIQEKYNIPFEKIVEHPEIQDEYFKNELLPKYKKSTEQIIKTIPQSKKIDAGVLTAMHQLGPGNVKKYLKNEADDNIKHQMEHFLKIANEYTQEKKQKENEKIKQQYEESFSKLKNLMANQNRLPAEDSEE